MNPPADTPSPAAPADERAEGRTPAAQWRAENKPDPHGDRYDCERAKLTLGSMTDDELANAVFMYGNDRIDPAGIMRGKPSSIAYLTAAKDRIRWLSRALAAALARAPAAGADHVLVPRKLDVEYRIVMRPVDDQTAVFVEVEDAEGRSVRFPWHERADGLSELRVTVAAPPAAPAGDLVAYLHRQWAWSKKTFGPALRTKGVMQHIRKELAEIEADPHDLSEWVDVIILAMDGFWRHGGAPEDLLPRMQAKQDKNFARTWLDWRMMGEDQAIEHDRSGEATRPVPAPPAGRAPAGVAIDAAKLVDDLLGAQVRYDTFVTDPENDPGDYAGALNFHHARLLSAIADRDSEIDALRGGGARGGVTAELRALSEAATPGPWSIFCEGLMRAVMGQNVSVIGHVDHHSRDPWQHNSALIVAAVNFARARIEAEDRLARAQGGEETDA